MNHCSDRYGLLNGPQGVLVGDKADTGVNAFARIQQPTKRAGTGECLATITMEIVLSAVPINPIQIH